MNIHTLIGGRRTGKSFMALMVVAARHIREGKQVPAEIAATLLKAGFDVDELERSLAA